jgi:hypothetical protein
MWRIIINGYDVDLGDKFQTSFNRSFLDLQNVDSKSGDWSYGCSLPKSRSNNLIFSNSQDFGTIDKFVKTENYNALAYYKGELILEGYFKLTDIDKDFYNGHFVSNSVSWSKDLAKLNLNEIRNRDGSNWTVPFLGSHDKSVEYSLAWYIEQRGNYDLDIAFPLSSYGNFFSENPNNPFDSIDAYILNLEHFPPAPFNLKIIEKIFETIGWSIDGGLFNDPQFKKIAIPYTFADSVTWNYDRLISAAWTGQTTGLTTIGEYTTISYTYDGQVSGGTTSWYGAWSWLPYNSITRDINDNFRYHYFSNLLGTNKTGITYNVPVTTDYNIVTSATDLRINLTGQYYDGSTTAFISDYVTPTSGWNNIHAGLCLYIDDGTTNLITDIMENINPYIFSGETSVTHPNIIYYYDLAQAASGVTKFFQPYIQDADIVPEISNVSVNFIPPPSDNHPWFFLMSADTTVTISNLKLGIGEKLKWIVVVPSFNDPIIRASSVGIYDNFVFDVTNSITGDTEYNISKNLPDNVTMLDYVKSFLAHPNLFFTADFKKKVIRFDTYTDFWLPVNFGHDITDKVFLNKLEPAARPVDLPRVLRIKYNNDLSDALLKADPDYANIELTNTNIYAEGEKEISLIWSATKMRDFRIYNASKPQPFVLTLPSIANEESLLKPNTEVNISYTNSMRIIKLTDLWINESGQTNYLQVDGYLCAVQLSTFESDDYLSLNYHGDNGMYNTFFARMLYEWGDSHILTLETTIDSYDYNKLQPNVPVIIGGVPWILYSIQNFNPDNPGKCKIELMKKFSN